MKPVLTQCPACAAEIAFKEPATVVVVCEFCSSVVARTDRAFEDLGKVGELLDTQSDLQLGLHGRIKGKNFSIVGRTQISHAAGGAWDEWYLTLHGGAWGWLAEAQGEFHLTTRRKIPADRIPDREGLSPGDEVRLPTLGMLKVAEVGAATYRSAEGQIPFSFTPGESFPYVDLTGHNGRTVTIDYGADTPVVYAGRKVELEQLGLTGRIIPRPEKQKRTTSAQLECAHCASPLELLAPDKTQRVVCPSCNSLLDTSEGKLRFLRTLELTSVKPRIPIGTVGKVEGREYTVIGFLQRGVKVSGITYKWQEYLLYNPGVGFRWLVENSRHWMFARPVDVSEVTEGSKYARYNARRFRKFDQGIAEVRVVYGEFYWQVGVGDMNDTRDYISPPEMISREKSSGVSLDPTTGEEIRYQEINYTLGRHMPVEEVREAFGVQVPTPTGVGAVEPFPVDCSPIYKLWALFAVATVLMALVMAAKTPTELARKNVPLTRPQPHVTFFEEPLAIESGKNVCVEFTASVNNSWVYVAGDLVNEESGLVVPFAAPIEYYHGVSGGESWSEGGRRKRRFLSAMPAGNYTLRLELSWDKKSSPSQVQVTVRQGVHRKGYALLVLLAVSVIPLGLIVRKMNFESARWKDSPFNPYSSE